MRKTAKKVIAAVESCVDDGKVEFDVIDERSITLRFPNAVYRMYGSGYSDFAKKLSADEARAIGSELIDAADRVTSAEHIDV